MIDKELDRALTAEDERQNAEAMTLVDDYLGDDVNCQIDFETRRNLNEMPHEVAIAIIMEYLAKYDKKVVSV